MNSPLLHLSDAAGMRFTVSPLPAETSIRLKIFARNSKGRSDYVWLRGQTLRAPDRDIENRDTHRMNQLPDHQPLDSLFRRPLLLFFVIASSAVLLTVASMSLLLCRQFRGRSVLTVSSMSCNSGSRMESHTSSEGLNDSQEALKRSSSSSCDGNKRSLNEEFCDQQLVSRGGSDQFSNPYAGSEFVSSGPPDIIPSSFPFTCWQPDGGQERATTSFALDDKNLAATFALGA